MLLLLLFIAAGFLSHSAAAIMWFLVGLLFLTFVAVALVACIELQQTSFLKEYILSFRFLACLKVRSFLTRVLQRRMKPFTVCNAGKETTIGHGRMEKRTDILSLFTLKKEEAPVLFLKSLSSIGNGAKS